MHTTHTQKQLSVGFSSKMGEILLPRIEALLFWSCLKTNVCITWKREMLVLFSVPEEKWDQMKKGGRQRQHRTR